MTLSPEEQKWFRDLLSARERVLRAGIHDAVVHAERELQPARGRVHDSGEESFADLVGDLQVFGVQSQVSALSDVEGALARIAQGVYGVCVDCGDDVAHERLRAYPTAKRCAACQARHENIAKDRTPSL